MKSLFSHHFETTWSYGFPSNLVIFLAFYRVSRGPAPPVRLLSTPERFVCVATCINPILRNALLHRTSFEGIKLERSLKPPWNSYEISLQQPILRQPDLMDFHQIWWFFSVLPRVARAGITSSLAIDPGTVFMCSNACKSNSKKPAGATNTIYE